MKSQAELDAIVAALREAHPELRGRLTSHGVMRVLRREGIARRYATLPIAAMTVIQFGRAAICIDPARVRNPREEAKVLAEEYAHAKLHAGEPGEATLHLYAATSEDPREYEADYLARCLLAGPGAPVEYRTPVDNRPRRPVRVSVPPAFNPYESPPGIRVHRPAPRYGGIAGETALQRALRRVKPFRGVVTARSLREGPRSDDHIVLYENGAIRYVDQDGRPWRVYDLAYRPTREVVSVGSLAAKCRLFVSEAGARRRYVFTRWELREAAGRHFERQLRESVPVAAPRLHTRQETA